MTARHGAVECVGVPSGLDAWVIQVPVSTQAIRERPAAHSEAGDGTAAGAEAADSRGKLESGAGMAADARGRAAWEGAAEEARNWLRAARTAEALPAGAPPCTAGGTAAGGRGGGEAAEAGATAAAAGAGGANTLMAGSRAPAPPPYADRMALRIAVVTKGRPRRRSPA